MHYVKQAIIPFVYLFFVSIIALGIFMIPENLQWLRIILLVLNVGLYGLVACATAYKDGQDALKVRIANDLERMEIIRTGEDRPLKIKQEYAPWKGFLTGGIVCVPLIILLIVHTILVPTTGATGSGAAAGFIYMFIFGFFRVGAGAATPWMYMYSLFAIPVILLCIGVSYILGARKIQRQQDAIKEKQRSIYGDKF